MRRNPRPMAHGRRLITFDASLLTAALNARAGLTSGGALPAGIQSGAQKRAALARETALRQAPWTPANAPTEVAAKKRVRDILSGVSVVTTQPRGPGGGMKTDQEQLFGAYQALEGLRLLAERATAEGVGEAEMLQLQTRFRASVADVSKYLGAMDLQRVIAPIGAKTEEVEGTLDLARGRREYVTRPVHTGRSFDPVEAWQSLSGFTIVANRGEPSEQTINVDLSELGASPRTLDTVTGFINGKLEAAGLVARFSKVQLPAAPGAKAGDPPSFALRIRGTAAEELEFIPNTASAGIMALTASGPANARAGLLTKVTDAVGGDPVFAEALNADPLRFTGETPTGLDARASAVGPDGSVYVVGDAGTPVAGNLGLRGERDVVLSKYDSAGRRLWSRTLGATESASGFSVAVGADGTVAVAGAIRGFAASETAKGGGDAVVATFDSTGAEKWVRQIGGTGADEARAVAIAADGTVYVAGRTRSGLDGANGGGWDGFAASFSATGDAGFVRQFADGGDSGINALAISGNDLVLGGEAAGTGTLRKIDASGADIWSRQTSALGAAGGIRALAVDGATIVAVGASNTVDLGLGGAQTADAGGGVDAFVMKLTDGASPTADWTRTFGGARIDGANAVTLAGGAIYVASTQQTLKTDGVTVTTRAAIDKLALADGAQTWRKTVGADGAEAVGVVIDPEGSSELDAFGLPNGAMLFESGAPLVQRTALRVGDSFSVRVNGGVARRIEIEADDTLASVATKINSVLRSAGKAEARARNDADYLVIGAAEGQRIDLVAGPEGRDVLEVLGLPPGEARKPRTDVRASSRAPEPPVMPLNFRDDLAFSDSFSARKVRLDIERIQRSVRTAFEYIYNPPAPPARRTQAATGPAPAALQSQLANYQAGLARLELAAQSSGSGIGNPTLSLFGLTT